MATQRIISNQDGLLDTRSIATTRQSTYEDVDLSWTPKPNDGDIYKKRDVGAVLQALETILRADNNVKPFDPSFGVGIDRFLFDAIPLEPSTVRQLTDTIQENVRFYEPRCEVIDTEVDFSLDNSQIMVTLTVRLINTNDVVTFTTSFNRVR